MAQPEGPSGICLGWGLVVFVSGVVFSEAIAFPAEELRFPGSRATETPNPSEGSDVLVGPDAEQSSLETM